LGIFEFPDSTLSREILSGPVFPWAFREALKNHLIPFQLKNSVISQVSIQELTETLYVPSWTQHGGIRGLMILKIIALSVVCTLYLVNG
jgi:hypothetical protein